MSRLGRWFELFRNMGMRYVAYRIRHELWRRSGLLQWGFPVNPRIKTFIQLPDWQKDTPAFFFHDKTSLQFERQPNADLASAAESIRSGRLRFFNAEVVDLGKEYDWTTNPSNQYRFDPNLHWTKIPDFSPASGDIKYVWEKSRFSWVYTLIRDDYHNVADHGEYIFSEIDAWISANPINCGPNWRCSQEISLRTMNWVFALYYYRQHAALNAERFQRILHVIYWQLRHVYRHIDFSRIAVRNNHAVTECLMLYVAGLLFPFFPEAAIWKKQGKKWFEEEVTYQVYEDGTFLQFSHNYHRVLLQLLTYAFYLSDIHKASFAPIVYERAKKTLDYLYQCQSGKEGELPNYGANDGALFFPLNNSAYPDYRPQINALYYFFTKRHIYPGKSQEDVYWWSANAGFSQLDETLVLEKRNISMFPNGGIYLIQDEGSFTFFKCAEYKDRPLQADNLHLDIWINGENVLRDSGTYRYNTEPELARYFSGSKGHNTVMLDDFDHMQKGARFIWWHWNRNAHVDFMEQDDCYIFRGSIDAFAQVGAGIGIVRTVKKMKGKPVWHVQDLIGTTPKNTAMALVQHWHPNTNASAQIQFDATRWEQQKLTPLATQGWYSDHYGVKKESPLISFSSKTKSIHTIISVLDRVSV